MADDLAQEIRRRLSEDPDLAEAVDDARFGFNVSEEIFRIRTELGLTQKQLAEKTDTQQSVIARMENADYRGHSLSLLRRIASATGTRLEVRFVAQQNPAETTSPTAPEISVRIFQPNGSEPRAKGSASISAERSVEILEAI